jgi:hypothetical protein
VKALSVRQPYAWAIIPKSVFILWAVAGILVTPLCGLFFSCGCDWPWNGLFMACDAILDNTPPPHCPWCVNPLAATLSIGSALAVGTLVAWKIRNGPWNRHVEILYRPVVGVAVFASVLFLGGWLAALASSHPSFLGMGLN